jgi:hypothetical protein
VHGDFIIGLPDETKETINKTIDFAKELDCETIQVSLTHAVLKCGKPFHGLPVLKGHRPASSCG